MKIVVDKMPKHKKDCPYSEWSAQRRDFLCAKNHQFGLPDEPCDIDVYGKETCPFFCEAAAGQKNTRRVESHVDWKETFFDLLTPLCSLTHGKQMYFEQDDGAIYSRISCKYLSPEQAINEYIKEAVDIIGYV